MQNKSQTNILGTESIGKLLFKMATPAIAGQLVNMLYNIVDRIFISRIPDIGTTALTGVGVTFPITMLIAAFASLIGTGGAPRAAIKMGENNYDEAENILGNSFTSLLIISGTLTVFFLLFAKQLLLMFGASQETLYYGLEYIRIYVLGTVFVQLTLGLNTFISCQGFPNTSMKTIFIGAGLNILLDFIFIKVFDMGVKGAAYATIISQAVSAIWVLRFLIVSKKTKIRIKKKNLKIKKNIILQILALGISPFIMQSTESLLNIAFNSSLKNYGGDIAVGTMTIIASIMQCITLPTSGLCQGAQPIISFNYGAGNIERVKKTFKYLITTAVTFTTIAWVLMMITPSIFINIFIDKSDPTMPYSVAALRVYMLAAFVIGAMYSCQQTFVALGQAKASLFMALLRKIILLIPLIYILPNILPSSFLLLLKKLTFATVLEDKVFAIFLSECIADFLATLTTVTIFTIITKKIYRKMDKSN